MVDHINRFGIIIEAHGPESRLGLILHPAGARRILILALPRFQPAFTPHRAVPAACPLITLAIAASPVRPEASGKSTTPTRPSS